jgi:hypothetical protein
MLSSVVWRKDVDRIGPGFIPLAQELGRIRPGQNEKEFEIEELQATWAAWRAAPLAASVR